MALQAAPTIQHYQALEKQNALLLAAQEQLNKALDETRAALQKALALAAQSEARLASYQFRIAELERLLFGAKTERFQPLTPPAVAGTLFSVEAPADAPTETTTRQIAVKTPVKAKNEDHPGRKPLPEHLEREEIILDPEESTEGMTLIGREITEVLEYKKGKLWVKRFVRPKYARKGGEGILTAPLPEQPIERCLAGTSLLAYVLISGFVDSLPIYRQLEIFKRQGVELAPATVSGWVDAAAGLLVPLYDTLRKQVLRSHYLQCDETVCLEAVVEYCMLSD